MIVQIFWNRVTIEKIKSLFIVLYLYLITYLIVMQRMRN